MFDPMFLLARTLQIIGILYVGYGLFVGVFQDLQTGQGGLALDLRFAAVGGACFLGGWLIQKWKGQK